MTSKKGSGLIRTALDAYRTHFFELMGAMTMVLCVSAMAFVPLLFVLTRETAFLCWLCPAAYVLLVLPLRGNAADCLQDALEGASALSLRLIFPADYGRKLLRGLRATLWALPLMIAVIVGYLSFAGDLDAMTLYAMIVKLGGGDPITGVKRVALMYFATLLPVALGLLFHCMKRHCEAAGIPLSLKLRIKGAGVHLASLVLFVPFGIAAFFPLSAYAGELSAALDAFLSDFVLALPDPVPYLLSLGAAALVLLIPAVPLRNLLLAALARRARMQEESTP